MKLIVRFAADEPSAVSRAQHLRETCLAVATRQEQQKAEELGGGRRYVSVGT